MSGIDAVQTVMRKNGIADAYEQMKALSRGKPVSLEDLRGFVSKLKIEKADRERLLKILG
jgi:adenylosuccinate lyase